MTPRITPRKAWDAGLLQRLDAKQIDALLELAQYPNGVEPAAAIVGSQTIQTLQRFGLVLSRAQTGGTWKLSRFGQQLAVEAAVARSRERSVIE